MLKWILDRLKEKSTWQGAASIVAAIVMYFAPGHIDRLIELLLMSIGIPMIVIGEKP